MKKYCKKLYKDVWKGVVDDPRRSHDIKTM